MNKTMMAMVLVLAGASAVWAQSPVPSSAPLAAPVIEPAAPATAMAPEVIPALPHAEASPAPQASRFAGFEMFEFFKKSVELARSEKGQIAVPLSGQIVQAPF